VLSVLKAMEKTSLCFIFSALNLFLSAAAHADIFQKVETSSLLRQQLVGRTSVSVQDVSSFIAEPTVPFLFNVKDYGAVGDGNTDDTGAFSAAFQALVSSKQGTVYFPTGNYHIGSTVTIDNADSIGTFSIRGDGPSSVVLWSADSHLFSFQSDTPVNFLNMHEFTIASAESDKSSTSSAIHFTAGITKSSIHTLWFIGKNSNVGAVSTFLLGSCLDLGTITDTVSVTDVLIWGHTGDGIKIGKGSEVRISGGRVISFNKLDNSVGIHVTGGNGGVHVWSTDLIGGNIGMLIDNTSGAGSNREIFLTHATIDSNWRGLAVADDSFVSIVGCWAASSDADNIWISPDSDGAQLVINGGTIFNAGTEGGDPSKDQCNGITVNAGSFQISGTSIRDNKGRGIWVVVDKVQNYVISGCRIFGNGQGMQLAGSGYVVTSNAFAGNSKQSDFGSQSGGAVVSSNSNQDN
jgi:hypothetical protein